MTKTPTNQLPAICVIKHSSHNGSLLIKPVSKQIAKELIVNNHYSHKWNDAGFGVHNFGIFRVEDEDTCLGVASYGYMKMLYAKIFTHPNPDGWMCELNRLWINDCLGKNSETILIAASIKMLRKIDPNIVAIQSFADGRLGCGTIYKAANFKYYGYHMTIFLRDKRTGEVTHQQNLTNTHNRSGYLLSNVRFLAGRYKSFKVKTYRYIYPLCKHFEPKFKEQSYPIYEKGEHECKWVRDIDKIKENIYKLVAAM